MLLLEYYDDLLLVFGGLCAAGLLAVWLINTLATDDPDEPDDS